MRTIQDMIQQEVLCCMSALVANLAEGDQFMPPRKRDYPIAELCAQALELAAPMIKAGCRYFTIEDAQKHWETTRKGEKLLDETRMIVRALVDVMHLRGLK